MPNLFAQNLEATIHQADSLIQLNRHEEAIKLLNDFYPENSEHIHLAYTLAKAHYLKSDYQMGVNYLNKVIPLKRDFVEAIYLRGKLLYEQNDYAGAREDFLHVSLINTAYPNIYNALGILDYKEGRYEQALLQFERERALHGGKSHLYFNRGLALFKLGKKPEAMESFNLAIKKNPKDYEAIMERGHCYLDLGNYKAAIKDFEICLNTHAFDEESYHNLALAHYHTGNFTEAGKYIKNYLKSNPNDLESLLLLAAIEEELGHFKEAIEAVERMKSKDPKNYNVLRYLATLYYFHRDWEHAEEELSTVIENQKNKEDYLFLAEIQMAQSKKKAAWVSVNNYLEAYPEDVEALDLRIQLAEDLGKSEQLEKDRAKLKSMGYDFSHLLELDHGSIKSEAADYYHKVKEKFDKNPLSLSPKEYLQLYYGQAFQPNYDPFGGILAHLLELEQAENWKQLAVVSDSIYQKNPGYISMYNFYAHALEQLGKKEKQKLIESVYHNFMEPLSHSHLGNSFEEAIHVCTIRDEYLVVSYLACERMGRDLEFKKGKDYDVLHCSCSSSRKDFYFDIELPWKAMNEQLK